MAGIEEGTPDDAHAFHLSTDVFREHERIAAWREVFGRTVLNIDVLPREKQGFVPDLGTLFANHIPAANPALQMLLRYIELAQEEHVSTNPDLQTAFANHVCDLLALALGATRDAAELARTRGGPAARLQAMKDDIRRHCHRPDLSVHAIAARYGVSARYVQRVFEESGSTVTQYITEQRLAAAYKVLRRPASSHVPITTIAFDCGFSDVSHFNRLFRRRFGCTPSEARDAAQIKDD